MGSLHAVRDHQVEALLSKQWPEQVHLNELHPLQEKFEEHGALQCGFCGPGMLISAKNLLDKNPEPTVFEVRDALSGNLCRCTGYTKIIEAIIDAGQVMNSEQTSA